MPKFTIPEKLYENRAAAGTERLAGFLQSQMLCNGFTIDKPHSVTHDTAARVYVIEQADVAPQEAPSNV